MDATVKLRCEKVILETLFRRLALHQTDNRLDVGRHSREVGLHYSSAWFSAPRTN